MHNTRHTVGYSSNVGLREKIIIIRRRRRRKKAIDGHARRQSVNRNTRFPALIPSLSGRLWYTLAGYKHLLGFYIFVYNKKNYNNKKVEKKKFFYKTFTFPRTLEKKKIQNKLRWATRDYKVFEKTSSGSASRTYIHTVNASFKAKRILKKMGAVEWVILLLRWWSPSCTTKGKLLCARKVKKRSRRFIYGSSTSISPLTMGDRCYPPDVI